MGKPRIDELEQAILDAIKADAALAAYVKPEQVQTLSRQGFDFASEQFVLAPPAVLVFYAGGPHEDRNIKGDQYRHCASFILMAVAANLRGAGEARRGFGTDKGAYDIVDDLRNLFAGKELELPSLIGVKPLCFLRSVGFEAAQDGLVVYSLEIEVLTHWG